MQGKCFVRQVCISSSKHDLAALFANGVSVNERSRQGATVASEAPRPNPKTLKPKPPKTLQPKPPRTQIPAPCV